MFDIGIATSIAKHKNYSWSYTAKCANTLNVTSVQLYLPSDNIIPDIRNTKNYSNRYLHLPNDYFIKISTYLDCIKIFQKRYKSSKIIIHQNDNLNKDQYSEIISLFNKNSIMVGMENESYTEIDTYLDLVESLSKANDNVFAVLDVHRFYHNFHGRFDRLKITNAIMTFIDFCAKNQLKVVIHVIDSISYDSDRKKWVPVFHGIVPYKEIFNYLLKIELPIESIILEYESMENIIESINNINSFLLKGNVSINI